MSIGLALFPAVEGDVAVLEKNCGTQGIRKAVPLSREEMVQKLTSVEALNSVATAQEVVVNAWKEVDSDIQMKRNRLRLLVDHWNAMLRTVEELRKQDSERMVRYVIAHQMQSRASIIPDGRVILDIGANVYVEFAYDEAEEKLRKTIDLAETLSGRLLVCLEECKRNIVTSEVNLSQLHNYSVEIRDMLRSRPA